MKIPLLGTGSLAELLRQGPEGQRITDVVASLLLHAGTGELLAEDMAGFGFRTWKNQAEPALEEPCVLAGLLVQRGC